MTKLFSWGLAAILAGTVAGGQAFAADHSGSVTIGAPAVSGVGTSLPFGSPAASWGGEYQQAYDYTQFGPTQLITGLTFFTGQAANSPTAAPSTGIYTLSLSSAKTDFFNLSSNLTANIGADNTIVYTGALPSLSGGTLTITFPSPFYYNPGSAHDLLLDVKSTNAANANPLFFDFTNGSGPAGVVTARTDSLLGFGDQIGLVTQFSEVPEPASMIVLGTGLLGLYGARRRV